MGSSAKAAKMLKPAAGELSDHAASLFIVVLAFDVLTMFEL
jgi:hypothetical protein